MKIILCLVVLAMLCTSGCVYDGETYTLSEDKRYTLTICEDGVVCYGSTSIDGVGCVQNHTLAQKYCEVRTND